MQFIYIKQDLTLIVSTIDTIAKFALDIRTQKYEKKTNYEEKIFGVQRGSNPGRPRESLSDLSKSAVFCSYLFEKLTLIRSKYIFATALICLLK